MKDADERKVGRAFSNAFIETALASTNPLTLTRQVDPAAGTDAGFLQVRTESGSSVTIDSITVTPAK